MSNHDNQDRAQKAVDSWPSWKKEVSLTKYSSSKNGAYSNTKASASRSTSSKKSSR